MSFVFPMKISWFPPWSSTLPVVGSMGSDQINTYQPIAVSGLVC